jgi:hypothetical protein
MAWLQARGILVSPVLPDVPHDELPGRVRKSGLATFDAQYN